MREIGVGYDGSAQSQHALEIARALAARFQTNLSAFEAVSIPTYYANGLAALDGSTIPDLVKGARADLAALGGVEPHAAYGIAAEELAVYSASLDLLVIGSRSYGPVGRLVHGSTAQRLAGTARCPLLVLTRAARKSGATEGERERQSSAVN
jgi:nucleotide-binding universal stress UspA family protein